MAKANSSFSHAQSAIGLDRRRLLGLVAAAGAAGTAAALGPAHWALAGVQPAQLGELAVISSGAAVSKMHFFPDAAALLAHGFNGPIASPAAGLEFFDSLGTKLVPVFDQSGQLSGVQDSGDGKDPDAVTGHLRAVVLDIKSLILEDPEWIEALNVTVEEALACLPQLDGVDLATAFDRCREVFGFNTSGPGAEDDGSFFHNLFAHGW